MGHVELMGDERIPKYCFMGEWREEEDLEVQRTDGCRSWNLSIVEVCSRWWDRVQSREEEEYVNNIFSFRLIFRAHLV